MSDFSLAQPFWLLLWLPAIAWLWHARRVVPASFALSYSPEARLSHTWRSTLRSRLPWMRYLAFGFLFLSLARPQKRWQEEKVNAEALDIVLAMDISLSMLSRDFDPDRLEVAKRMAIDFVQKRTQDRIGLVAFAAEAFTQCPLTTDKNVVTGFIHKLQPGRLEHGTAIGMGLATAVNRLKDGDASGRLVILITDGENNAGYLSPMKAAELAAAFGIRVYTVGIGSDGIVMSPEGQNPDGSYYFAPRMMHFDTELLEEIAAKTNGRFYRAQSAEDLAGIYAEIDHLEKTKVEIKTLQRTHDYYQWPLLAGLVLFLLEFFIVRIWMRSMNDH
jgi:Ca-activated chloride channel family protein